MIELTSHQLNPANNQLKVQVLDEPGDGGACHAYRIGGFNATQKGPYEPYHSTEIVFQNGPIPEKGVNGITHEALLAILEHRLEGFQSGPFACEANEKALFHVREAMRHLHARTNERMARGVEGTHTI